ncbi:MAG: D-amino acid aminotransferase, partial [Alphaproteobacteria bacterium]|nr:D-amino acid aminotransferase [Alphaproteobacteria bacterium]
MSRISYLNGQFLPHENCLVHIEDRGFQFADGAYEVTLFENGKLIDGDAHIERFFRSLRELRIEHNFTANELKKIQFELFKKNGMDAGTCYIQITRGMANRVPYVPKNLQPTISATVSPRKKVSAEEFARGFSFMTHEDIRWKRCDIKSIGLCASSLVNQKAKDDGFDDAIFVRDSMVTEGTFANIFIVDCDNILITKPADNLILQGITRNRMIMLAKENGIKVVERNFSVAEMLNANEVFLTSSSLILRPA